MQRVAVIIKYFPPSERISGLTSLASLLFDRFATKLDLHVLSQCSQAQAKQWSEKCDYTLHPVNGMFWFQVGDAVKKIDPQGIVLLSGIHKASLIYPVLRPLVATLGDRTKTLFYQCVNLDHRPGRMARRILERFDRIICSSPRLMSLLSEQFIGSCTYVPPGVDLDRIRGTQTAAKGGPLRMGYFNHLNKIKGCDIALAAFVEQTFNDTEFVIAGTGPMEDKMRSLYSRQEKIKFLGYLPDPIPEMKACDAMILPFRTAVSVLGISQTALECLAAGIAVIGSDNDAITTAVRNEKEGLIFQFSNQLVACIRRFHNDLDLRSRLSRNAARRAEEFRIESTADSLYSCLVDAW